MHALFKARCKKGIALKPVALAVALALPNVGAFAASMQDVISTRAAQSIAEQYGRDSLYAFSPGPRRFKPGQNPTNSSLLSRSGKSYGAGTTDKKSSSAMHGFAHSPDLLSANRPQPYGRAGGYIGWERVVMMRLLPATVAASAFQGRHIVRNGFGSGHGGEVADLSADDSIYRRKPPAGSGNEVSGDSSVAHEGEGQSAAGTNAVPRVSRRPDSASTAPAVSSALRLEDQPAALIQPVDDTNAMHQLSGIEHPNTESQRDPDPFTAEDHSSPTVRRESDGLSATDNGSGTQSDPVVRALPEQAPLHPNDEGHLSVEDQHFDPVPVESLRDASVTANASLAEADPTIAIVAPLTAPSDGDRESPADIRLEEELRASLSQYTPEIEVTVSVVGEQSSGDVTRMSKRSK